MSSIFNCFGGQQECTFDLGSTVSKFRLPAEVLARETATGFFSGMGGSAAFFAGSLKATFFAGTEHTSTFLSGSLKAGIVKSFTGVEGKDPALVIGGGTERTGGILALTTLALGRAFGSLAALAIGKAGFLNARSPAEVLLLVTLVSFCDPVEAFEP